MKVRGGYGMPNLLSVHASPSNVARSRRKLTFAMDLLSATLEGAIEEHQQAKMEYSETLVRDVFRKIMRAAVVMHQRGVVHRDIATKNIMLRDFSGKGLSGADTEFVIIDFGLSRTVDVRGSRYGQIGTLHFLAPEAVSHVGTVQQGRILPPNEHGTYDRPAAQQTQKSDVWSLGVVLFNLLTGRCARFASTPARAVFPRAHSTLTYARAPPPIRSPLLHAVPVQVRRPDEQVGAARVRHRQVRRLAGCVRASALGRLHRVRRRAPRHCENVNHRRGRPPDGGAGARGPVVQ